MRYYSLIAAFCLMADVAPVARAAITRGALAPVILPPQVNTLTLSQSNVTGGVQVIGTVALNKAASSAGSPVTLHSSNSAIATVPAQVIVPGGATSTIFIVQTLPVAQNPNVVTSPPTAAISARIGSGTPVVANLTVTPPTLVSLTVNPTTVTGGTNATGIVTLSGPAQAGGITISLTTPDASAPVSDVRDLRRVGPRITLPAQVTVSSGATSASFAITTIATSIATPVEITATYGVFVSKTATLTVGPPTVDAVSVAPRVAPGGVPVTGTVTLTAPAPAGGLVVNLSVVQGVCPQCYPPCGGQVTVVPTVTVPGGATSATFPVTTTPGWDGRFIHAMAGTELKSDLLSLLPPKFEPVVPSTVKGGTVVQAMVQLTGPALPSNCKTGPRYKLSSNNTTYAPVPAYVDVPAGGTQVTFAIPTVAMPANAPPQTVRISATGWDFTTGFGYAERTFSADMIITP